MSLVYKNLDIQFFFTRVEKKTERPDIQKQNCSCQGKALNVSVEHKLVSEKFLVNEILTCYEFKADKNESLDYLASIEIGQI